MVAMTSSRSNPRPRPAGSPFSDPVARPVEKFAVGDRVTHDQCGLGRIIGVEEGIAVLVDFGGRELRIGTPYPKLSKL
jgi:hypothetical protein